MESQRGTEIKVGLFVMAALAVGAVLVFVIGSSNQAFDRQVSLYTAFRSVSGLKLGSQVRLAGLKIGVVDDIAIGTPKELGIKNLPEEKPKTQKAADGTVKPDNRPYIRVRMKVRFDKLIYIRTKDSTASIQGKGLLGDSLVEISMGNQGPTVKPGGYIKGETPRALMELVSDFGPIITSVKKSLGSVQTILAQYSDPALATNLKGIVSNVNGVLTEVRTGKGLIHDLIYPSSLVKNFRGIMYQINGLTARLKGTLGQVNSMLYKAQKPGTFVHRLLISRKSGKLVKELETTIGAARSAMAGLASILQAPQRKGTLLHTLLYTKETSRMVTNIVKTTDYLRTIMRDIRRGKGSLGALINDPTAFEDFKTILGQVKRSRIFKALIRFVIKRDDSTKGSPRIQLRPKR